jgi:hypothetical protein
MWPFRVNAGVYMAKVNYMHSKKVKVKKHTAALYKIYTTSIQKNSATAQYNKQMM